MVLLEYSTTAERCWLLLHTDRGPLLLGAWYWPPDADLAPFDSLEEEYLRLLQQATGVLLVGDFNAHHVHWLKHSGPTNSKGRALKLFCDDHNLSEHTKVPTRPSSQNLLDLTLSDLGEAMATQVVCGVSDHSMVKVTVQRGLAERIAVTRYGWNWKKAQWKKLRGALKETEWSTLLGTDVHAATEKLTNYLLTVAKQFVPYRPLQQYVTTHPWLNDRVRAAVQDKVRASSTTNAAAAAERCSAVVLEEYKRYTAQTRDALRSLPSSSRKWWKVSSALLHKKNKCSSVPPLKDQDGNWVRDATGKANLFARTWEAKSKLPPETAASNTALEELFLLAAGDDSFVALRKRTTRKVLRALDASSGTGPDLLPARLLKECADELELPVTLLCRLVLEQGWPNCWKTHWIHPIFKKGSVWRAGQYRGVHLTPQLSKVVERCFAPHLLNFFFEANPLRENQFAYTKGRGHRDAEAYLLCSCLWLLESGYQVGLYLSDLSGAFDKTEADRVTQKCAGAKLPQKLVRFIASYLQPREGRVVVEGQFSDVLSMSNMVWQGSVLGPQLWNTFYADVASVLQKCGATEIMFADDLNAFCGFPSDTDLPEVLKELEVYQTACHQWGFANRVEFDASKEHFVVLHRQRPHGENFVLLGTTYDPKLTMHDHCEACAARCRWKVHALLKLRCFFDKTGSVRLYKAHVLPLLEAHTAALYHAAPSTLALLDKVQHLFLRGVGLSSDEALLQHNLAPLRTRRDLAMLGLLHRCALEEAPPQLLEFFPREALREKQATTRLHARRHSLQLLDRLAGQRTCPLHRSLFGLVAVYNLLPPASVRSDVKNLQRHLQELLKTRCAAGQDNWEHLCGRAGVGDLQALRLQSAT